MATNKKIFDIVPKKKVRLTKDEFSFLQESRNNKSTVILNLCNEAYHGKKKKRKR